MAPKAASGNRSGSEAPLAASVGLGSSSTVAAGGAMSASGLGTGAFAIGGTSSGLISIPPSIYPKDSIKDVAEQLGLTSLRDNVAAALASDVEYRIREVLQDASKYMRHAKRSQLRTSDIDAALRAKNIEPLYGYFPSSSGRSSHPSTAASLAGPSFRKVQTPSGPIYYIEDEEIDFEKVLSTGPTLTLGKGVGWSAHWLAVEGIQPAVPQNPSPVELGQASDPPSAAAATAALNGDSASLVVPLAAKANSARVVPMTPITPGAGASTAGQNVIVKPLIKHVLSRELQLYYERLTTAILTPPSSADTESGDTDADDEADADADAYGEAEPSAIDNDRDTSMASAANQQEMRPSRTRKASANGITVPSKTLAAFTAKSTGNTVRDAALASLRGDPGLHQIVPYLVQWVGERISFGLLDENLLGQMMMVVHALLVNSHIHIEPYLHQVMPSILSVLLTASLGPMLSVQDPFLETCTKASTPAKRSGSNSYQLRAHAGALLAFIVSQHSASYPSLRTRIVSTLIKALLAGTKRYIDPDSEDQPPRTGAEALAQAEAKKRAPAESAGTKLGAVIGLRRLGSGVVRAFLLGPKGVQEPEKAKNALRLLGLWLNDQGHVAEQSAAWILKEIRAAAHGLTAPLLPAVESIEDEKRDFEEVFGVYWAERLGGDVRARKGLLLALHDERVASTAAHAQ